MLSCSSKLHALRLFLTEDRGSSILETVLLAPVFVFALVATVDFGQGYYTSNQIAFAAHAAALYGVQYPTDTTGITAAATSGSGTIPGMTVTVTTGCECSDGTGASDSCASTPSCPMNVVDYVDVKTNMTYTSILPYPGIPSTINMVGRSRLRTAHNGG